MALEIRTAYDTVDPVLLICDDHSLAKQEFKDDCDFNVVMSRYQAQGINPADLPARSQVFEDVSNMVDYHTAVNVVLQAQSAFDTLPSSVRERFGNDPGALLTFLDDSSNRDEAVRLGIVPDLSPESPPKGSVGDKSEPPKEA